MTTISLRQAKEYIGKEVTIHGWLANKRSSGKIQFLEVRDGAGFIQGVVVAGEAGEEVLRICDELKMEASIELTGMIQEDTRSHFGVEILVKNIAILQNPTDDYPIAKKDHGPDFLLDNRHLWLRSKKQWAVQKIRNTVIYATYDFFRGEGFVKVDAPIFTPSACEGTTELFEVPYFDDVVYLSQSGQLYLEAAIMSLGKCFDFGPVFRAEASKTRRHLTEFWMMDAEAAFMTHEENMQLQERLICFIVERVLAECVVELKLLERDIEPLKKVQAPFIHMTHSEAIKELRSMGSDIGEMDDLGADDETMLTEKYDKPIFVEKYPAEVKAFYMKRDPANPAFVLNNDLLAPEGCGEIIGGSQREDDYDALLARVREHNLPEADFQWYLDLRKYGSVPHSGFGFGLERIVRWVSGVHHIRETIPFPRLIHRKTP